MLRVLVLIYGLVAMPSTALGVINAKVWYSSVLQPNHKKISFDASNLIFGKNYLKRGGVTVTHRGDMCDFSALKLINFKQWEKDCQLAVQTLYNVEVYVDFADNAGINIPSTIDISIQDEFAECFAAATYYEDEDFGRISFCEAKEESLDDYLKYSSDVLFHEMTHLALKNKLLDNYILASAQEDFATLFSYLLGGQLDFKIPEDSIYSSVINFGEVAPGNYGSLIALMSSIVDIQKITFKHLPNVGAKKQFLALYSKLIVDTFFEIKRETTQQSYLNLFLKQYTELVRKNFEVSLGELEQDLRQSIYTRGLDLDSKKHDGLRVAVLINDMPAAIPASIIAERSSLEQLKSPSVGLFDPEARVSKLPLTGFIADSSFFPELQKCLSTTSSPNQRFKERYFECFEALTKKPLVINGAILAKRKFQLNKHDDKFIILTEGEPARKDGMNALFLFIFDQEQNLRYNYTAVIGGKSH